VAHPETFGYTVFVSAVNEHQNKIAENNLYVSRLFI
jgi:hypothetical protein